MKTVGQHNFSKQECFHILNGFEFVEMSKTIVKVNVMGTRRLRAPTATDIFATDLTEKNKVGYYWNGENSEGYKVACNGHLQKESRHCQRSIKAEYL
jgi:hypothetical protein